MHTKRHKDEGEGGREGGRGQNGEPCEKARVPRTNSSLVAEDRRTHSRKQVVGRQPPPYSMFIRMYSAGMTWKKRVCWVFRLLVGFPFDSRRFNTRRLPDRFSTAPLPYILFSDARPAVKVALNKPLKSW